ncbi:hypothetical protein [Fusobacterium ulcerans]|uniref:hypothetical protein n=1 Tax=Fusobacterium ulcerans TaxID=861 RepID=UPI00102FD4B4|nr:hypothetical protein [Fusobacterium ulcerans]
MKIKKEKLYNDLNFIITLKNELNTIYVPLEEEKIKIPFNIYSQFFDKESVYNIELNLYYRPNNTDGTFKTYKVGDYLLDKNGMREKNKEINSRIETNIGIITNATSKIALNLNITSNEGNYDLIAISEDKILATKGFNIRKKSND